MCLNRNSWQKGEDVVAIGPFVLMQSQASSIYNRQLLTQYQAADVLERGMSGWKPARYTSLESQS